MKTKVGTTAIYFAARQGKHETARILSDAGADVHLATEEVREKKRALSFYEKKYLKLFLCFC